MLNCLRKVLTALSDWLNDDGPWNYAGCCGCGRNVIDYALVTSRRGKLVPWEQYCRACWAESPTLSEFDHIEFPETLVRIEWEFADRIGQRVIDQREAAR